jgi:hypothetical protein
MHIFHKKISTYISDYIGTSNVSLADVRIISRKCHFKGFPYRTIIGIISDEIRNIDCIEGRSEMHWGVYLYIICWLIEISRLT